MLYAVREFDGVKSVLEDTFTKSNGKDQQRAKHIQHGLKKKYLILKTDVDLAVKINIATTIIIMVGIRV